MNHEHIQLTYADGTTLAVRGDMLKAIDCIEAAETWGDKVIRAKVYGKYNGLPPGYKLLAMDGEQYVFTRED